MQVPSQELLLDNLANDAFFNELRDGEFCLILGAGFSWGLKNKSKSKYNDEKFIPIVKDFVDLTNRRFNTDFSASKYSDAADHWERRIENQDTSFQEFKNLFLLDEKEFNKIHRNLYANILLPKWARIYTFNFDNVLDVLIERKADDYEFQYYDAGSFSPANKTGIGYLHNSILKAEEIDDLVFTDEQYGKKILSPKNSLYYSLFNDIEKHKKNLLIIGCGFVEQSVYTFLLNQISRTNLKIIHINYNNKPNYSIGFEKKVKDIHWINCTTEQFLKFLSDNSDHVRIPDFRSKFLERLQFSKNPGDDKKSIVKTFNDFLDSKHLKYYSRGQFKNQLQGQSKNEFKSENDFLEFINDEKFYGLIIHGQGGIGKTRLMLELSKKMFFKDYFVIKIFPLFEAVDELFELFSRKPGKKYLLVFDYIEEQKSFEKIIQWVIHNETYNIRIIGNCRNTFVTNIQNNFADQLIFIDIGFKNKLGVLKKLEQDYKRSVILSIINSISDKSLASQLNTKEALKSFYSARPSYAAFIKYIHEKNPDFDLNIKANDSFYNWLIKKLKLTVVKQVSYPDFFEKKKYIFQILSCLPATPDALNKLGKINQGRISFADEINRLIHDGWVDETTESVRVVHDTVNDTLLLEFLKHFQFRGNYVRDFLDFAFASDCISSMMWSLQRVWEDFPENRKVSVQKIIALFIKDILNKKTVEEDWFRYKLDNTQLIDEADRIDIFIKHKNIFNAVFSSEKYGSSLGYSMEWVYENITDDKTKKTYADALKKMFFEKWNKSGRFDDVVTSPRGGKIISSYINLYGIDDYIKDRFYEYTEKVLVTLNNLNPISLSLVSWVNRNGQLTERMQELITLWFDVYIEGNPQGVDASYLTKIYHRQGYNFPSIYKLEEISIYNLKATSIHLILQLGCEENIQDIKEMIVRWFQLYEIEMPKKVNPMPLALAWVKHGNDTAIVRNVIHQALIDPLNSADLKGKCIGLWLEYDGDTELVKPFLTVLESEIFYKTAYYILGFWLEKSELPLLVKPFLANYLDDNPLEPAMFSFIFSNWLSKGDEPDILIPSLKRCFSSPADPTFMGKVLAQFISSNGNCFELKDEIIQWLAKNANYSQAVSVLGFLLEKTNENSLLIELESPTSEVLKNFGTLKEVGFIIGYWLTKGGSPSIVDPFIDSWLKTFGNSKQGILILNYWLQKTGKIAQVKEHIIPVLKAVGKEKEASTLIFNWIILGDDPYVVKDFIVSFFEVTENRLNNGSRYLITSWLEKTNLPELVKDAINPWLAGNGNDDEGSIRVCAFWLQKGNEIELVRDYLKNYFFNFSDKKDSNQVFEHWMQGGGDLMTIEPALIKYLSKDRSDINTIYVIMKWLNKQGSLEILYDYIKDKFDSYCGNRDAFHVMYAWLKRGGDIDIIMPSIIRYLEFNWQEPYATRLIELCIKLNALNHELEQFAFRIIQETNSNPFMDQLEISVDRLIIKDQGNKEKNETLARQLSIMIRNHSINGTLSDDTIKEVTEYLKILGLDLSASHVIQSWIEYGNDFELIRFYLINWLNKYLLHSLRSSFVISAALENDIGFKVVHDKAIEWLKYFGHTGTAKYLLSSWLKNKNDPEEIKNWIFHWASNNTESDNWRDNVILKYVKEHL